MLLIILFINNFEKKRDCCERCCLGLEESNDSRLASNDFGLRSQSAPQIQVTSGTSVDLVDQIQIQEKDHQEKHHIQLKHL